jgi:hypothetical protein
MTSSILKLPGRIPGNRQIWTMLVMCTIVFFTALSVRQQYHDESIVNGPLRADAFRFYMIGYNLVNHRVFSMDTTSPPRTRISLPPGYPLFLASILKTAESRDSLVSTVLSIQRVVGSLTAVLVLLIGFAVFGKWVPATGASLLFTLSPHLVAINDYVLSETLFMFFLFLSVYLIICARKFTSFWLYLLTGIVLAFSVWLRTVSLYLIAVLVLAVFADRERFRIQLNKQSFKNCAWLMAGFIVVIAAYRVPMSNHLEGFTVQRPYSTVGMLIGGSFPDRDSSFIDGKNFSITAGKTSTEAIIEYWTMLSKEDKQRVLNWYLFGKIKVIFQWDNWYNSSVYQYPMHKKGFHTDQVLIHIYILMKWLHFAAIFLAFTWPLTARFLPGTNNRGNKNNILLLYGIIGYFLAIQWLLNGLPRYSIPFFPFIYLCAMGHLYSISTFIKSKTGWKLTWVNT